MTTMTQEKVTALRVPFPPESVGRLPKQVKRDDPDKGKCEQGSRYSADGAYCGGWHARSVHLDYVGHAAVTDRLLSIDPLWSWEPLAFDEQGLPAWDRSGNLWIKLTICGMTRLGVGDGKNAKEVIGDAIRNAAMRFGVALDLWAKEDLVEFRRSISGGPVPETAQPAVADEPASEVAAPTTRRMSRASSSKPATPEPAVTNRPSTPEQIKAIVTMMGKLGMQAKEVRLEYCSRISGRPLTSSKDLTAAEASRVIDALKSDLDDKPAAELDPSVEPGFGAS